MRFFILDCPDPRLVFQFDNAYLKTFEKTSSRAFGTSYYFRCSLFYTMYGDAQITCLKNSTWSTPAFECKSMYVCFTYSLERVTSTVHFVVSATLIQQKYYSLSEGLILNNQRHLKTLYPTLIPNVLAIIFGIFFMCVQRSDVYPIFVCFNGF